MWRAYHKAARGKRGKQAAAQFEFQLADNLLSLQTELRQQTYQPSGYTHFLIQEPKRRKISAAPFRDRVVHHALCNVIEPHFEARFHPHSYANRLGQGTHKAIDQLQAWSRQYRYVLRLDIVQHFPSLDHAILRQILFRQVQDEGVRWLINQILTSGEGVLADEYTPVYFWHDELFAIQRPRGLPIGNLTSQFWSNCYLNDFDWFVTRELGCAAYLRYVDDFALFSNSKKQLTHWKAEIIERLATLRLTLHTAEGQTLPGVAGIPWLGFIVYPTHRRLKRRNVVAFTRQWRHLRRAFVRGDIEFRRLDATVQGWVNHVRYGDSWGLRQRVLSGVRL